MVARDFSVIVFSLLSASVFASHFRGGLIQWKSVDSDTIEIFQRFSWRGSTLCDNVNQTVDGGSLLCRLGCSDIMGTTDIYCTDSNPIEEWYTGTRTYKYTFSSPSTAFEASFTGGYWITTLIEENGSWEVRVKGNTARRPDGTINSSPITSSTPIVRLQHGCNHIYRIPAEDPDGDIVKCRWARNELGECADVCNAFPNATLDEDTCIISYNASGPIGIYAVALQIEDYFSACSTTPMSSVPLQFLVNVSASNQLCSDKPVLVPPTPPHGSCIAVLLGTTYSTSLIGHSLNSSIQNFGTISPRGFHRTSLNQSSYNMSLYYINITWTPTLDQFGLNIFCFSAENSYSVTSEQSCITLVDGISGPRVLPTSFFPSGSFSPSPRTVWRMEFDQPIRKPQEIRHISVYEVGVKDPVDQISSDDAVFPQPGSNGISVTFMVNIEVRMKQKYYVLVEEGFAEGEQFCNQQSLEISNQTFWTFEIQSLHNGVFADCNIDDDGSANNDSGPETTSTPVECQSLSNTGALIGVTVVAVTIFIIILLFIIVLLLLKLRSIEQSVSKTDHKTSIRNDDIASLETLSQKQSVTDKDKETNIGIVDCLAYGTVTSNRSTGPSNVGTAIYEAV